jgi:hypothetical protein
VAVARTLTDKASLKKSTWIPPNRRYPVCPCIGHQGGCSAGTGHRSRGPSIRKRECARGDRASSPDAHRASTAWH